MGSVGAAAVDTSSYPKPNPMGGLDTVQRVQQLQSNQIGIQKQQLDLANQKWGYISKQLGTLAVDPDLTQDKVVDNLQQMTKMGLITPEDQGKFITTMPTKPELLRPWIQQKLQLGMDTHEAINWMYGQQGESQTGQTITPTLSSPRPGFSPTGAVKPAGLPVQLQPPPTTPTIGAGNQPQLLGAQPAQLPAGTVQQPGGLPGQFQVQPGSTAPIVPNKTTTLPVGPAPVGPNRNPAIMGPSSNLGGTVTGATTGPSTGANDTFAQRFESRGPVTGRPLGQEQLADTNIKQYAADQDLATQKMTAIKPVQQALKLLPGLMTGPKTAEWNNAVATLKAFGIISTAAQNDPTAIYQEVNKKLSQYVQGAGSRSDASQALAEESSPSVKHQISPALIALTRDAIAQDRVQAARAGAFQGDVATGYGQFRSQFPQSIDNRAFKLDSIPDAERNQLIADMKKKANTAEGKKFWRSLDIADKQNMYNPGQ